MPRKTPAPAPRGARARPPAPPRAPRAAGPPLGAHTSIAGGFDRAIARGEAIGCAAVQIFVKNASQWRAKPIGEAERDAFRAAHAASPIGPVFAHASYLINLAAADAEILARSRTALGDELERCAALGVPALVVHPGAHLGRGVEAGIAAVAASLDAVYAALPDCPTVTLLELTAGQGSVLGRTPGELAAIAAAAERRDRLGVCLDTCHAFAGGYAIDEAKGYADFFAEVEATVGLAAVACIHLNDSVGERGSHRDRHAHIGEGRIGLACFERLLADPRLTRTPMILETEPGPDGSEHARDLATLRGLVSRR
jgi:deoxyribonuclease-4